LLEDNELFLSKLIKKYKSDKKKSLTSNSHERVISGVIYTSSLKPNIKADNPLTMMEMLCLIFLVSGKEKRTCAKLLSKSEHTIKTYEQRIREKLMAKNRANAFYIALSKGYISLVM
jgi:DNA-binding NarL/FixJ family response regulator